MCCFAHKGWTIAYTHSFPLSQNCFFLDNKHANVFFISNMHANDQLVTVNSQWLIVFWIKKWFSSPDCCPHWAWIISRQAEIIFYSDVFHTMPSLFLPEQYLTHINAISMCPINHHCRWRPVTERWHQQVDFEGWFGNSINKHKTPL